VESVRIVQPDVPVVAVVGTGGDTIAGGDHEVPPSADRLSSIGAGAVAELASLNDVQQA
jgi:hypothetical protein